MAAMIWDEQPQAFIEADVPLVYDPESEAFVETAGMVWDAEAQAWTKAWPEKLWLYKDGVSIMENIHVSAIDQIGYLNEICGKIVLIDDISKYQKMCFESNIEARSAVLSVFLEKNALSILNALNEGAYKSCYGKSDYIDISSLTGSFYAFAGSRQYTGSGNALVYTDHGTYYEVHNTIPDNGTYDTAYFSRIWLE